MAALGVDNDDITRLMQVIDGRVESGQTGSIWQRRFYSRYRTSFNEMTEAYLANQQKGMPVHEWEV